MSPLCQGRICHTRRCTLSHDHPQDISSTALDNFFLILSLLFSASPPSFSIFCFYYYIFLIFVTKIKDLSSCLSFYLAVDLFVHLNLSSHLSRHIYFFYHFDILRFLFYIFRYTLLSFCFSLLFCFYSCFNFYFSFYISILSLYFFFILFYSCASFCMKSTWKIYGVINHYSLEKKMWKN